MSGGRAVAWFRCLVGRHEVKLFSRNPGELTYVGAKCRHCNWVWDDHGLAVHLHPRVKRFWRYMRKRQARRERLDTRPRYEITVYPSV